MRRTGAILRGFVVTLLLSAGPGILPSSLADQPDDPITVEWVQVGHPAVVYLGVWPSSSPEQTPSDSSDETSGEADPCDQGEDLQPYDD